MAFKSQQITPKNSGGQGGEPGNPRQFDGHEFKLRHEFDQEESVLMQRPKVLYKIVKNETLHQIIQLSRFFAKPQGWIMWANFPSLGVLLLLWQSLQLGGLQKNSDTMGPQRVAGTSSLSKMMYINLCRESGGACSGASLKPCKHDRTQSSSNKTKAITWDKLNLRTFPFHPFSVFVLIH